MAPKTLNKIQVTIDTREADLWEALEPWRPENSAATEDGWYVVRAPLEVGDIAIGIVQEGDTVTEKVLLERKTAEDLGASQRDGRYREQRARLLAKKGAGVHVGYLLEAPAWSATLSRSWCRGAFTEVALQTAIVRLQWRYGLAVFQAASLKETVQWIRRITSALRSDAAVFDTGIATTTAEVAAAYTEAIHVRKAANLSNDRILNTLLRTLPGVGLTAADAITQACHGNFQEFYEMSEADIASLKCGTEGKRKVGAALARKIWPLFHTSPENKATGQ